MRNLLIGCVMLGALAAANAVDVSAADVSPVVVERPDNFLHMIPPAPVVTTPWDESGRGRAAHTGICQMVLVQLALS